MRLQETHPEVTPEIHARSSSVARGVCVRQAGAQDGNDLRVRGTDLTPAAQAAVLGLDPLRDCDEYAKLRSTLESATPSSLETLAASDAPGARQLALRLQNHGIDNWKIWARGRPGSLVDDLGPDGPRLLVVDLVSLATLGEKALVSEVVLSTLWDRRADRRPVLIVIDEAHNVGPGEPRDAVTALATGHAVRIAGEGRKFGLHLLVSTQRPQKIHENALS